jgi:prolipoprotein diacylglyceryl transferase
MEFESQFIRIGQVQLQYYGIIIVGAMIIATLVGVNLAKRFGRDPEHIYGALTWAIIPGIIFARLWFVVFPPVTSTNTLVPDDFNYSISVNQIIQEGELQEGFLTGVVLAGITDDSDLARVGFQNNDRIRSVQVAGTDEPVGILDGSALVNALVDADPDAQVRVVVERRVPKDRNWYLSNFFDLDGGGIAIWSGGLSIFGALLGGGAGAYLYLRKNKLRVPAWLDIAAVCIPLAQAIGRWANYVNQELFGDLVSKNFPLALRIPENIGMEAIRASRGLPANAPIGENLLNYSVVDGAGSFYLTFHPLFLYESLWSLAAFGVLLWLYLKHRDKFHPGDFFLIFIAQYSFIRFLLEFLRLEVTLSNGVNVSQAVTAVAFVVSVALLAVRFMGRGDDKRAYDTIAPPEPPIAQQKAPAKPAKRERAPKVVAQPVAAKPEASTVDDVDADTPSSEANAE